jgi:LacI family transcriptional regulator
VDEKLSMKQLASKIGVSTATISRVINNKGGYSKETEEKVLMAIKKYAYVPDAYAKNLRTNSSHTIGVVVPDITNEFFAKIARTIDSFFLKHAYSVFICDTNEDPEKETMHIRNLLEKNVDGVIYISGQTEIEDFQKKNIPVIYIDRCPRQADLLVASDNEYGGYLAAKELIAAGSSRLLFLRDSRDVSPVIARRNGFLKAMQEQEEQELQFYELNTEPSYAAAYRKVYEAIQSKLDIDGVFATNDHMALGVVHALDVLGYKVPDDVKVVGFDNISLSKFCNPPLTTIMQDTEKLGTEASKTLMKLIHGEAVLNKRISIPVKLKKRLST